MLTRSSVVWADRMVATSSWKGVVVVERAELLRRARVLLGQAAHGHLGPALRRSGLHGRTVRSAALRSRGVRRLEIKRRELDAGRHRGRGRAARRGRATPTATSRSATTDGSTWPSAAAGASPVWSAVRTGHRPPGGLRPGHPQGRQLGGRAGGRSPPPRRGAPDRPGAAGRRARRGAARGRRPRPLVGVQADRQPRRHRRRGRAAAGTRPLPDAPAPPRRRAGRHRDPAVRAGHGRGGVARGEQPRLRLAPRAGRLDDRSTLARPRGGALVRPRGLPPPRARRPARGVLLDEGPRRRRPAAGRDLRHRRRPRLRRPGSGPATGPGRARPPAPGAGHRRRDALRRRRQRPGRAALRGPRASPWTTSTAPLSATSEPSRRVARSDGRRRWPSRCRR